MICFYFEAHITNKSTKRKEALLAVEKIKEKLFPEIPLKAIKKKKSCTSQDALQAHMNIYLKRPK